DQRARPPAPGPPGRDREGRGHDPERGPAKVIEPARRVRATCAGPACHAAVIGARGSGGAWMVALGLGLGLTAACPGKAEPDIAARSGVRGGTAERSREGESWQRAAAGDRFRAGDGLRTSAGGGARLRFLAGGGLRMGPSTTIRFGAGQLAVDGELEAEGED